jgi:hypothetical protein
MAETKESSSELPGKKLARQHAEFMLKNAMQFNKIFIPAFMSMVPRIEKKMGDKVEYDCDPSIECEIKLLHSDENARMLKWVVPAMKYHSNRKIAEELCEERSGFKIRIERAEYVMDTDANGVTSQTENVMVHFTAHL